MLFSIIGVQAKQKWCFSYFSQIYKQKNKRKIQTNNFTLDLRNKKYKEINSAERKWIQFFRFKFYTIQTIEKKTKPGKKKKEKKHTDTHKA